jgi:hypothetical protein
LRDNADFPDFNAWWHWQPLITSIISQPWTTGSNRLLSRMHFCTVTALGLMSEGDFSARLCTDAYLSALTISNGWRLVSFDRGFERFGDQQRLKLNGTSSA